MHKAIRGVGLVGVAVAVAVAIVALFAGATVRAAAPGAPATAAHHKLAATVVSLEFDHAFTDQLASIEFANGHGMPVTIFAISGRLGRSGYMTAAQLRMLQAQGDEIGGHTIDHPHLAQLPSAAQRQEICGDRTALESDGLTVTDFAYPFGEFGPATPAIVRSCGYQSAREAGGLAAPDCSGRCPLAETIPPRDPFVTRTADSVLSSTSLGTIEGYVTRAERARGGWVQIVFHYICDGCDPYSVTPQTLQAFVTWLASQAAYGTRVETVRQVIHTPFRPGAVTVKVPAGRGLILRSARRCPSTPVGAACSSSDHARAVAVPGGGAVTVISRSPASTVRLSYGRRTIRADAAGDRRRWRLVLPLVRDARAARLVIRYRLGVASYRLRLVRP